MQDLTPSLHVRTPLMGSIDYYYVRTPHSTAILCALLLVLSVPVIWVGAIASWKAALIPLAALLVIFVPAVLQERHRRIFQYAPALSLKPDVLAAKCASSIIEIPYRNLKYLMYESGNGYRYLTICYVDLGEEKSAHLDIVGVDADANSILQEISKRLPSSSNVRLGPGVLLCSPSIA